MTTINTLCFTSTKNRNRYSLLAEEWDRESGTVTYGSSRWKTPISSAYATILVEYRNLNRTKHRTVSPEGRTIRDYIKKHRQSQKLDFLQAEFSSKGFEKPYSADYEG
jgi:hypothetical protein